VKEFNNIILFGGETKNENMPVGFYSSLAMLPLRGKPVIWWQLDNLAKYGMKKFIIAVCNNNHKLIEYIKNVLSHNFEIELVLINSKKNILSSLKYALAHADFSLPTRVICGDTLISKSIDESVDTIYTSKEFTSSENWCLVDKNFYYYDKQNDVDISNKQALVGYYSFSDTQYLQNCCIKARLMLKKELSTALIAYQERHHLKTKLINDWYDLGHTSGLIKAKNILFSARDFNSITVDTDKGLLTKTSTKIQKLEDEAFWYENLPEELKIFAPRMFSFSKNEKSGALVQELYGYPSLQELYLSGEVNLEDWRYILEKLFKLHKNFEKYTIESDKKSLLGLYFDKTAERLDELKAQNSYWQKLLDKEYEIINGKKYRGILALRNGIEEFAKELSENASETIVHGDYCFSNILFDSSNYVFKLIDPRGRLNAEASIYGDPRYDIAKLRHSVVGLYDFIVQGLFKITETQDGFEYKILTTANYSILEKVFDNLIAQNDFQVREIKFIEGLLFLSMIPLHKDDFERQKMFYIKAIELLNDTVMIKNKGKEEWKKRNLEYV
jgi:aminoglycoside phosphotransferase